MLEQRERGEEPDFDGFMEKFGDFFPGNPQTLDELLEQMAQQMAQMQQLLNSMTPEQRGSAPGALERAARRHGSALADGPARPEPAQRVPADGLGPGDGLPRRRAAPALGHGPAARPARRHRRAREPDAQRDQPGPARRGRPRPRARPPRRRRGAFAAAARRARASMLEEAGLIEQREGRMELTPKGIRRIGQRALGDLFRKLLQDRPGRHEIERAGFGHERSNDHKTVRVRRSAAPRRRPHDQERDHPRRRGHAGAHHARRLRDRAHGAGHAQRDRADARRLALDGDAGPVPRGQEGRDGAARADQLAVPPRLPRHGELRAGRARGEARASPRSDVGLRVGHEHAARASRSPASCCRRRRARSRSS